MKDEATLKQIARDLHAGHIFTSDMIGDKDIYQLPTVFLPLGLMTTEQAQELSKAGAYVLYEYYDQALPRAINGLPMFMSFNYLTKEEGEKVNEYLKKIRTALKDALGE